MYRSSCRDARDTFHCFSVAGPRKCRLGALRRHPAVAFARASLVVLIALNAAVSVWLIAEFEGQYTEGPPSPARFYALAGVDGEYTMIDVSIENSTRLLVYQLIRDDVGPEDDGGGRPEWS